MASVWKKSKNLMYVLVKKNSHCAPFFLVVEDITVFFYIFLQFQQVPPYFCDNNKYIPFLMHFKYKRIVL